jgi:two-component system alkaline phosphatase synthesis response regulator PhoP
MSKRILIVEDEKKIAHWVRTYFERAGFQVLVAYDGPTGLAMARGERPDLMVLDLMLPGMDGLDVCRAIRQEWDLPIIMLTARAEEVDRLIGLELGADDYVVKPFSPRELVARARAVLRRTQAGPRRGGVLVHDRLQLDLDRHLCTLDGRAVELTPSEYAILEALMCHRGIALTRAQLLDLALGDSLNVYERTIDVHVRNLRRKLEPDPSDPLYILTVFGVGYKFVDSETVHHDQHHAH